MNDSVGRSRADQQRIKVALVFGGRSSEHAISCVSAGSILRNLDQAVYEVVAVGVTPEGGWVLTDGDPAQLAISDRTLPQVTDASGTELLLATDPRRAGQLVNVDSSAAGQVLASVDVVFPVLHGPYGEDGTIQDCWSWPGALRGRRCARECGRYGQGVHQEAAGGRGAP